MNMFKNRVFTIFITLCCACLLLSCGISKSINHSPDITGYKQEIKERVKLSDTSYSIGSNVLTKNKYGQWELIVSGDPYEIGLKTGSLTQEIFKEQEHYFLSKVNELVPSKSKQWFLRNLLAWYNRKIYLNVLNEYKSEIFGLSKYASNTYNHVAENYLRVLYLHGAHDIGHALQDLALVGCSSFAVWGNKTEDGKLLIGRNFDFYAGDDFAKHKIIAFVKPSKGYKFMSVTWPGMIGVVSGMNDQGLTVTINAGKSKVPLVAKTPISILTREILQYASTIAEAIEIAKKRKVFVSESILIGSAKDNKAVTIEVSPENFGVYEVDNTTQLICSNHFQSPAYANDKNNITHKAESHSQYRYLKMEELLAETNKITPQKAVDILRNKEGLKGKAIGYGNEKALNQLLAHHGIVFQPHKKRVWVSSHPYQLGAFVAFDLENVFNNAFNKGETSHFFNEKLTIKKDDFQYTQAYTNYELYRVLIRELEKAIKNKTAFSPEKIAQLKTLNPEFWYLHFAIAEYYRGNKYYRAALNALNVAKTKEITTLPDKEKVEKYIRQIKRKLNE